jgi:hypothetical protein
VRSYGDTFTLKYQNCSSPLHKTPTKDKIMTDTSLQDLRYHQTRHDGIPDYIVHHEDLRRIIIGLANDKSGRIITMELVEQGGITWRRFYFDRGSTGYNINMVGQYAPGLGADNLMAAWKSVFGDVLRRRKASSDPARDNHRTKRILVAFTRTPQSTPIWASWGIILFGGGRCYPRLSFWPSADGLEELENIEGVIDLTTLRNEVREPDLWQTTILDLLGRKWNLDFPPEFYEPAGPPSVQYHACQTDNPAIEHVGSQTDPPAVQPSACQTDAFASRDAGCQTDNVHVQSQDERMNEFFERIEKQAGDPRGYWEFDELDIMLLDDKDDVTT